MTDIDYTVYLDALLDVATSDDYFAYEDMLDTLGGCPFDTTPLWLDDILAKYNLTTAQHSG